MKRKIVPTLQVMAVCFGLFFSSYALSVTICTVTLNGKPAGSFKITSWADSVKKGSTAAAEIKSNLKRLGTLNAHAGRIVVNCSEDYSWLFWDYTATGQVIYPSGYTSTASYGQVTMQQQ
jgi:hypothetical protein